VILYDQHTPMLKWLSDRLGMDMVGPDRKAVGVLRGNELVAVVAWSNFVWPDIHVHMASTTPRWCTRSHVREILYYPFVQLQCKRVTALTEATNQRARAFLCHLGFRQEGIHPDACPNGDVVSLGLLARDAARWLVEEKKCQAGLLAEA
jgi:RimJ/RimL family protein N-acetyltransferase